MFLVFDDFAAWVTEARKPVSSTCMTGASCVPPAFGSLGGMGQFSAAGLSIDDGDWFSFSGNPQVSAIGFSGYETRGKSFGICIMGMGNLAQAPLYMYSRTGFIGVVSRGAGTWTPNQIHAAPGCSDVVTLMHYAD